MHPRQRGHLQSWVRNHDVTDEDGGFSCPEQKLWFNVIRLARMDMETALETARGCQKFWKWTRAGLLNCVKHLKCMDDLETLMSEFKTPWFEEICDYAGLTPAPLIKYLNREMTTFMYPNNSNLLRICRHLRSEMIFGSPTVQRVYIRNGVKFRKNVVIRMSQEARFDKAFNDLIQSETFEGKLLKQMISG